MTSGPTASLEGPWFTLPVEPMLLRIPLLQRYILGEILRAFFFVLTCITILLVFVGVFQQATERGMGAEQVLKILPYIVPSMLPFTIPAALLLTISVVYGRLSGDLEVTAAKAAGIHPLSLMWPAFLLGGILSVTALVLTDQVIPWSVKQMERQFLTLVEDIFIDQLKSEQQFSDPANRFHITVARVDDRTLIHPVIRYVQKKKVHTLKAESAEIHFDLERQFALVKLHNPYYDLGEHGRCVINKDVELPIRMDLGTGKVNPRNFPIEELALGLEDIASNEQRQRERQIIQTVMALTSADFERLTNPKATGIAGLASMKEQRQKFHTEIHSRYALSCSCFFFALLGTPFAILYGKSQFLTSFLLCFTPIVGGYYPLMLGLMAQAKMGNLAPEWSMWLANALLLCGSWFALRRVIRY